MRLMRFTILVIAAVLLFVTTGCLKCACCGPYGGQVICIKGTDSVSINRNPVNNEVNMLDSLAFYRGLGYTCTGVVAPLTYNTGKICGNKKITAALKNRDGCYEAGNYGDYVCGQ